MSPRWLTPGLALVAASVVGCANQGKGVGTDVIDELCNNYYREAVVRLHSPEGIAAEDDQTMKLSTPAKGSCRPVPQETVENTVAECQRNQIRVMSRCSREQQAALDCVRMTIEKAPNRQEIFNTSFDCWYDVNKNNAFDPAKYWTLPPDAGVAIPEGAVWDADAGVYVLVELPMTGDEPKANGELAVAATFCPSEVANLNTCASASGPVETPDAGQP